MSPDTSERLAYLPKVSYARSYPCALSVLVAEDVSLESRQRKGEVLMNEGEEVKAEEPVKAGTEASGGATPLVMRVAKAIMGVAYLPIAEKVRAHAAEMGLAKPDDEEVRYCWALAQAEAALAAIEDNPQL